MTINVLFAAGDVGGARALTPVIQAATAQGHRVSVLRHGHITQETETDWRWLDPGSIETANLDALINDANPEVVIFATSVKDPIALSLARRAQAQGIKTIHVLDSWTSYRARMTTDGLPAFSPDIYAVMDTPAAEAAADAGISETTIQITGQPALSDILARHSLPHSEKGHQDDKVVKLLFVSEPITFDQGSSDESSSYRGYTEIDVMQTLCRALQPMADRISLSILPHPRDDVSNLSSLWIKNRQALQGVVLPKATKTIPLERYDGIIGMASILLYESWLLGQPTLSIQPNLRQDALRQIDLRPGTRLIDSPDDAEVEIQAWVKTIEPNMPLNIRAEAKVHILAPQTVLSLALKLAAKPNDQRK